MEIRFAYLPYRRKFRRPLTTAHGLWEAREGIVIRMEKSDGKTGFGEMAPLPVFGTESFEQALAWCRERANESPGLDAIPDALPCCQWAVASALSSIHSGYQVRTFPVAALVDSPKTLRGKQDEGFSVFKVKIGLRDQKDEAKTIQACLDLLEADQMLRLDANGGLSESDLNAWLECLEGGAVEYLEQPLAPGLECRMLEIAEPFSTPVALDESIAGMPALSQWKEWPGPLVVKPSLLGRPGEAFPGSIIGSSVFETSFGLEAALQFLARHQATNQAIGFDTINFIEEDGWNIHVPGPTLTSGRVEGKQLQRLWESLQ